jgi:ABC-2 type transport system permease protein
MKTSCFNGTLAKNSLRRFWPLPVGVLLYYLLGLIVPFYRTMQRQSTLSLDPYAANASVVDPTVDAAYLVKQTIYGYTGLVMLLLAALALLSALLVFHHLHSRKEIQFYLGLPLKRRCLYLTELLTGYALVAVPMLLCELIVLVLSLAYGGSALPALALMAMSLGALTAFYGMAVLACILAGHSLGALLIYAGMHSAGYMILMGASVVARSFLPGLGHGALRSGALRWFVPLWKLISASLVSDSSDGLTFSAPWVVAVYAGLGVLLLMLGGILYGRRKAETAEETVSFPFVRVLCQVFAALAVGLGGSALLLVLFPPDGGYRFPLVLLLVLVLTLLGHLAAEMILQKSLRVFRKKTFGRCLPLLALILLVMVGGKLDLLGYVQWEPDLSQVESASVTMSSYEVPVAPYDALTLHETILENLQETYTAGTTWDSITISYTMEGGSTRERTYYLPLDADSPITQAAQALLSAPDYCYSTWFEGWEDDLTPENFCTGGLENRYGENGDYYFSKDGTTMSMYSLTAQDAVTLYKAVCRDIEAGNLLASPYVHYEDAIGELHLARYQESYDPGAGTYSQYQETTDIQYGDIQLTPSMTYTLAALEDLGFTVLLP